jgi:hypothetical protein
MFKGASRGKPSIQRSIESPNGCDDDRVACFTTRGVPDVFVEVRAARLLGTVAQRALSISVRLCAAAKAPALHR